MADTRPTPVGFFGAARLCLLLLFRPARFIAAEQQDADARSNYVGRVERDHGAYTVRRAFLKSFLLVLVSASVGYGAGPFLGASVGCATSSGIAWLQVVGACLLLWGTLFVRGWEIQTYSGAQFTERVNQVAISLSLLRRHRCHRVFTGMAAMLKARLTSQSSGQSQAALAPVGYLQRLAVNKWKS